MKNKNIRNISGDWTYSVANDEATITGYSGAGGEVDSQIVTSTFSI